MKARKPTPISPCEASVAARIGVGMARAKVAIAAPNRARIRTQSSIEPSWFAQTPEIRYISGLVVWECCATSATEKSDTTNA